MRHKLAIWYSKQLPKDHPLLKCHFCAYENACKSYWQATVLLRGRCVLADICSSYWQSRQLLPNGVETST